MRDFPQELVDLVIDKLAEPTSERLPRLEDMSKYSTVSRQWVERAQKHHFRSLLFSDQDKLVRWCTEFKADPSGVSRHVRQLFWRHIDTLQGFGEHIRALTHVKEVELLCCGILGSLSDVQIFTLMGSSLVELVITGGEETTSHIMTSLLAGLPCLHHLYVGSLKVKHDPNARTSPPTIPFFEGGGVLILRMESCSPGTLDWIPPTARFRDLRIEAICIHENSALVNQWLASSGGSLEYLTILAAPPVISIDSLDLSGCTSLKYLQIPVPLARPGQYTDVVLPSLSSSRLSRIDLGLCKPSRKPFDRRRWEAMDGHLQQLAKQYKATHGGKMMEARVIISGSGVAWHLGQLKNEWPMPGLRKEAVIMFPAEWRTLEDGHGVLFEYVKYRPLL